MCQMGSRARWAIHANEEGSAGGRRAGCLGRKRKASSKSVPRHRRNVGCPPTARDTIMDMYDQSNPDRFDHGGSGGPPFGEAWRRCCDRLRAEVGDAVFNSWFGSLTLESVGSGQARLSVPTRFLKSWIVTHYAGHVASALNAEVGPVGQILISVRSSAPLAPPSGGPMPECASPAKTPAKPLEVSIDRAAADRRAPNRTHAASAVGDALTGSPLDRRLTFATFQVGRSNELAFNAVQRVANPQRGGTPAL